MNEDAPLDKEEVELFQQEAELYELKDTQKRVQESRELLRSVGAPDILLSDEPRKFQLVQPTLRPDIGTGSLA